MAVTGHTGSTSPQTLSVGATGGLQATAPDYYATLADVARPNKTRRYETFTSLLMAIKVSLASWSLTGAKKNAGTSDEVEWFEEGRLHSTVDYTAVAAATGSANAEVTCDNTRC